MSGTTYGQRPCATRLGLILLTWLFVLSACDTPASDPTDPNDGPETFTLGPLIDNNLWTSVDLAQDPFAPSDPTTATVCEAERYGPEIIDNLVWFDVDTIGCDYLTVTQPSIRAGEEGASLRIWFFHFAIVAVTGDFQVTFAAGENAEKILWQRQESVPAESALWYETVTLNHPIATGEPIWFNISNHGQNTWSLIELSTVETE
jgi:hypothetical protein